MTNQETYWDAESVEEGYCTRQIEGLKQLAVTQMIDRAISRAAIYPKRILEIGGGSQHVSRHLCRRFPNAEVVCTDISSARIEEFSRFYKDAPSNLRTLGGVDARALPFGENEFDLIVGDAMLHHIDFLKPALFEVRRCMKDDGTAVFVREPIIGLIGVMLYRLFQIAGTDRKHIELNYYEYKRMLSQWRYEFMMAGFSVKSLRFWPRQGLAWRLRALFPNVTPCYIGFVLKGVTNVKNLSY